MNDNLNDKCTIYTRVVWNMQKKIIQKNVLQKNCIHLKMKTFKKKEVVYLKPLSPIPPDIKLVSNI